MTRDATRRRVLAAGAVTLSLAAAGCRGLAALGTPPRAAPGVAVAGDAIAVEARLIAHYGAVLAAVPARRYFYRKSAIAAEPLDEKSLAERLPQDIDVHAALLRLQEDYATRGVNLVRIGGKWTFRTAGDLSWLLSKETVETRKLSRAAIETLAIIAYHQPVTRAEIEEIRGVTTSKGSVDVLLETGWIRPRGRRKSPGRPVTYGTSEAFLSHFGLDAVSDLPGLDDLKGSGLLDGRLPPGFSVPMPSDDPALREDEDPLEPGELDLGLAPPRERSGEE